MIILDTNVLSALMQSVPEPKVIAWMDAQARLSLWTTSITAYEIRAGLEILPASRKRERLEDAFAKLIEVVLDRRVLPFDFAAAEAGGAIAARQRRAGRPVEIRDVQIAGIAAARKATLATRNLRHFDGIRLALVDPWST